MKINAFNLGMPYYGVLKKLVLIMKMIIIIMTICLVQVSAAGLAQKVTLNEKETPLQNIIQKIRLQTGYDFIIDAKLLDKAKKVTINVNNAGLEDALDAIFKNQQLSYSITDKVVAIEPKEPTFLERLAERWADRDVRGRVVDETGNPMPNASIQIKGTSKATTSNDKGEFVLKDVADDGVLVIRYVGYKALEIPVKGATLPLEIKLNQLTGQLEEVAVKGNTGYQVIDKNHPGSFDVIDNQLLNRSTSSSILERIQNLTPGLLFDKTPGAKEPIMIRGKNSINLSAAPLIVLDNFPYNGDINNINPNDIESVTILKDAAAASIWGARAGNGVIVLTSKKGKTDKPQVTLRSNMVVTEKTDLFSAQTISPSDYVDLEQFLFDKGFYNGAISNVRTLITPAVEIMAQKRNGSLTTGQASAQLDLLRRNDVRDDLMKYFYRTGISQQNHLSISGNPSTINYRIAAAWDKTVSDQVGRQNNRINLNSLTTFRVNSKLQFDAGIAYTRNNAKNGNNPEGINPGFGKLLFPYANLVDDKGNGLVLIKDIKASYLDNFTSKDAGLLDWKYRPYVEIDAKESISRINGFELNTSMKYEIVKGLSLNTSYQFLNQVVGLSTLNKVEDYSTRNLINSYYQSNSTTNKYPIPLGGIMDNSNSELISHQGRVQLDFGRIFGKHGFSGAVGWEITNKISKSNGNRIYGYNREGSVVAKQMDFVNRYTGVLGSGGIIPNILTTQETLERTLSSYANLLYAFDSKYHFYGSIREDAANLFGVKANERGTPLWSIGGSWQLSRESFYKIDWLPQMSFKVNYGFSGRFANVSAFTLIARSLNTEGAYSTITSVPNENLRWERNGRLNIGVDFAFKNNRISGNLQYYKSKNVDLLDLAPVDPTLGLNRGIVMPFVRQNVASVKGQGFEMGFNTRIVDSKLKWDANWNFSYAYTKVAKRLIPASTLTTEYLNRDVVIEGKPMNNYYAYKWGGLDPLNGDPQGYMGANMSKDYNKITTSTKPDSLIYIGQSQAPYFGSILNRLDWKSFALSFNISYQAGYYFRRNSVQYGMLFNNWAGHGDYAKRWQQPGDEAHTSVPSLAYPNPNGRDLFYQNSEILMEKGDHVRLEDIQLNYTFNKKIGSKFPFRQIGISSNISNMNILLWKANKYVDPNFNSNARLGKTITFGVNLTL